MEWYCDLIYTRSNRHFYGISDTGIGEEVDSEELDYDGDDDQDGPFCSDCGHRNFINLERVDSSEIAKLLEVESKEARIPLARLLEAGNVVDWDNLCESGESEEESNSKRKYIGKKVNQR